MPILPTDILFKVSTTAGAAGNTTAAGAPGEALGKYVSTTLLDDGALNNLFPDRTGAENDAETSDYQCIFVHNTHATLTLQNAVVWLKGDVGGGVETSVGVDSTVASAVGSATPQALQIADKNTAPDGVGFSPAASEAAGLPLGDIGPGQVKAIWVLRWSRSINAALNNDGATVRVDGDTAAA